MTDAITVLRARGRRLCKTITADGAVRGYDDAKHFDLSERPVAGLAELHATLAELAGRPDCCIVRAGIADPTRTRGVRRLLHADTETGDAPTLLDTPRRWVALDIDGVAAPDYLNRRGLFECGMEVSRMLPAEFRGCGFVMQATAQHCIAEGLRLRLWFWLGRPTSGAELRYWFRGCSVDFSAFSAAQVCYTASPIFATGTDILPRRIELMPGPETVRVPSAEALAPPPPPPPKPLPDLGDSRVARYAAAAMQAASIRIRATPIGGRHAAILAEARGLGRLVAAGTLPESAAVSAIASAARAAGKADENEISAALHWGFAHASPAAGNHVDGR